MKSGLFAAQISSPVHNAIFTLPSEPVYYVLIKSHSLQHVKCYIEVFFFIFLNISTGNINLSIRHTTLNACSFPLATSLALNLSSVPSLCLLVLKTHLEYSNFWPGLRSAASHVPFDLAIQFRKASLRDNACPKNMCLIRPHQYPFSAARVHSYLCSTV